ncbi:hypothetical protein NDU88_001995 [Pleurodeles waltl]|uniref:Ubiquitin-like protease family profile domain-containing protein n=1 Tax=Pleurodeles waltl TaxID=8319 RepID=A0AAV7KR18_PLEWA|nr:hypothetical protein NDU88_001995 [Pleurodeles waltl]
MPTNARNKYSNIFSHIWDLQNWKIENPIQWKQTDSESCGVFVCTVADVVSRGILMSSEGLSADNLQHIRRYHASSLMQILRKQMEKGDSVPKETELHTEQLTPKGVTVGAAERVFEKSKTRKSLVQGIDGTKCMAAKVMVCLYQESADLKKK